MPRWVDPIIIIKVTVILVLIAFTRFMIVPMQYFVKLKVKVKFKVKLIG